MVLIRALETTDIKLCLKHPDGQVEEVWPNCSLARLNNLNYALGVPGRDLRMEEGIWAE